MRSLVGLLLSLSLTFVGCSSAKFQCETARSGPASPPVEVVAPPDCPISNPQFRPTNLVFQGGGVKGIAYIGALQVLEQQAILPAVENVAGTSAGAITATLVALGYEPDEIAEMMFRLDFSKLEDGRAGGFFRLFRRYGFFKGDYFLNWMRCAVQAKTDNRHTTFAELAANPEFLNLKLFTTDVNAGTIQELSAEATPSLEVALAVRMSMSIPYFFASVEHGAFPPNDPRERRVFVDGGVLFNYPITVFDDDSINPRTLGFVLLDTRTPDHQEPVRDIDGLLSFTRALVEADLNVQVDELRFDSANLVRTVVVNDLGVPTTDFNLSPKTKKELVASGENCTCRYLRDRPSESGGLDAVMNLYRPGDAVPKANFEHCGWVLDQAQPDAP